MRNTTLILSFLILLLAMRSNGQSRVDSLKNLLGQVKKTARLELLDQFAIDATSAAETQIWAEQLCEEAKAQGDPYWEAMGYHHLARALSTQGDITGSQRIRRKAMEIFKSLNRKDKIARQLLNYGNASANLAQYDSAMMFFKQALDLAIESKDSLSISGAYLNISTVHHDLGELENELEYLILALELSKKMNDTDQVSTILYNLAVFYLKQGQIDKCNEILDEVMAMYVTKKDYRGQANVYNLLAQQQFDKANIDSSLYYLDQAISLYEKLGEKSMVAFITMNQGSAMGMAGRWKESILKLKKAYDIFMEIGELRYASICLHGLSASEEEQGNPKKSIEILEEAILISKEIKSTTNTAIWIKELAGMYHKVNDHKKAYELMLEHTEINEELAKQNNQNAIQEMEAKYQNEKKQLEITSLEQEKALQQAQIEQEKTQRFALLGGLLVALLLFGLAGLSLIQKRRDNKIIQSQKLKVEEHRDELQIQKQLVELRNREITDSIHYAKRIQNAILPPDRLILEALPQSFVFYKPKDVVAGDFYWLQTFSKGAESNDQTVLFAAADCTGHGVPGAMVSVICNNGLNRSVKEFGLRDPGEILDKTRELVIQEFEKSEEEVKDGMDISLCALNTQNKELLWAGANNPLWIVRNGADEIEEIKADKQPIGKYGESIPFTTHKVQLNKGDTIYIFTDGYHDQFGGENGKKYKSVNFKQKLLAFAKSPIEAQKSLLDQEFEKWRGALEQVDDVCVIGVRV